MRVLLNVCDEPFTHYTPTTIDVCVCVCAHEALMAGSITLDELESIHINGDCISTTGLADRAYI